MLRMCVYMHSHFIENHPIQILNDGPLISEVVLSHVCHSRLCHLNFGSISQLSSLNLIMNLSIVKGYKCQSCVQSKQTRKSHKAVEEGHLAPLELIHSDICEINCTLIEGGQRYFMTMIDDASRYCYVYLLKTKDKAPNYFKTYKAGVEN
jgi:hypothetical protein